MQKRWYVLVLLCMMPQMVVSDGLDTLKGVWSSVKSFPLWHSKFWKGLGQSFGAPPTGYQYSFDVYNDMRQPVYVSVTKIFSAMGGDLPEANSSIPVEVLPYSKEPNNHYQVLNEPYYFEMLIKSTNATYSSNMPYLLHPDVLYRHDAMALDEKGSKKLNYYRAFMGKQLQNGAYVHVPSAESLGYINQDPATVAKDPGNVSVGTTLSSLVIHNSSQKDYFIGFVSKANATTMTKATCQAFAKVQADSFGLLNTFGSVTSLTPGTIGLFDATSQNLLLTYSLPTSIFGSMVSSKDAAGKTTSSFQSDPYTLEIYQDTGQTAAQMDLQGLMSGNYDQPIGAIREITPISCIFWYQSVAQLSQSDQPNYIDLPGKVWVVAIGNESNVIASAVPGNAVSFAITRPEVGAKLWIYFVYLGIANDAKDAQALKFLKSFLTGTIATSMLQTYQSQAAAQMQAVKNQAANAVGATVSSIPQSQLIAAAQGALQMNGGQITDPVSGVTGYLLGGDIFLSNGVGMQPFYYNLQPSMQPAQGTQILPQQVVQNLFDGSASSMQAPQGMPTAKVVTGTISLPA